MNSLYVFLTGRRLATGGLPAVEVEVRLEPVATAHGPEDLLLRDPVALGDVREDGRREPVALLREPARRLVDLRALLLPGGDELGDPVELLLRVDRADVGVLVERVADAECLEAALQ